jgi:hypothetical protein
MHTKHLGLENHTKWFLEYRKFRTPGGGGGTNLRQTVQGYSKRRITN